MTKRVILMHKPILLLLVITALAITSACKPGVSANTTTPTETLLAATVAPTSTKIGKPSATVTLLPSQTPSPTLTPEKARNLLEGKGWQVTVDYNGISLYDLDEKTTHLFFARDGSSSPPCWAWSPDGSRIIYNHYGFTNEQIDWPHQHKITNMLTGETLDLPKYVTDDPFMNGCLLRWHPQDKAILLGSFLIRPEDGSLIERITEESVRRGSWSTDGRKLVYMTGGINFAEAQFDAKGQLSGVKTTQSDCGILEESLACGSGSGTAVKDLWWSPVADVVGILTEQDIYLYDWEGKSLKNLTQGFWEKRSLVVLFDAFTWSPDGQYLAFTAFHPIGDGGYNDPQVFAVRADGSGVMEITGGDYLYGSNPAWSPDGEWVFYAENTIGQVIASKLDGSERLLVSSDLHGVALEFRPVGEGAHTSASVQSTLEPAAIANAVPSSTPEAGQPLIEESTWTKLAGAPGLPVRGMQSVFDSSRNVIVLFGGTDGSNQTMDQTWEFNGKSWTRVNPPASPPKRFWHGMAYDSLRKVTILFGGEKATAENGGGWLNDTWEYDGVNWSKVDTAHKPSPRGSGAKLAYDSCRGKTVLFGGYDGQGLPSATWEYDGQDWMQVITSASPNGRSLSAMVFDSRRCKVVLFGGGKDGLELNDTWEYDGVTWTPVSPPTSPPARWGHAMAYNPASGHVVLFGGFAKNNNLKDTWVYDGASWQEVSTRRSPSARQQHALAFDGVSGQVILLGGYNSNGDWAFMESTAQASVPTALTPTPACGAGWTRLKASDQAILLPGEPNWVRTEPSKGDNSLGKIYPGALVRVLEGPVCSDGLVYWKVESAQIPGGAGWTAEGDGKNYWLQPYTP